MKQETFMEEKEGVFILLKPIFLDFKLFCIIFLFGIFSTILYNTFSEKLYRSGVTFILNAQDTSSSSSPLIGYAKVLGINAPKNMDSYILMITESNRLRRAIAKEMLPSFQKEIDQLKLEGKLKTDRAIESFIISKKLKLGKNLKIFKDNRELFMVSYINKDAQISFSVIKLYLLFVEEICKDLELIANKHLLSVLDKPEFPVSTSYPKKLRNLIVGVFVFSVLGVFFIYMKFIIIYFFRTLKLVKRHHK